MLAPLSWLKEYVTLPPLEQLIKRMDQTGTTVASVSTFGEGLEDIIVGQLLDVNPHPNADKLQLTTVQIPGKKLSIVCGAKNIEAGQKVPVARIGTSVPVGPEGIPMKIERRKIRDVESEGMLCSAKELGLGDDHSGILTLDPEVRVGTKLSSVLNLPETVLDTEVTTNRGDELSIYGIARELGAVTGSKVRELTAPKVSLEATDVKELTVKVEDPKICRRYSAVVLSDLKLGPSPAFIQTRLRECGMRPINNLVDVTNYVMLLTGQPLHAFDYGAVKNSIIVRESAAGERVTTLDGVTRVLGFGSIVIADTEKILGLAGVMGGEDSGVTELTDSIVLESAIFNPVSIRQTVMKYNLRSEASHRFERGVDIEGTVRALSIATDLLKKYAGGIVAGDVTDIYPDTYQPAEVTLTQLKLNQYLGGNHPLTKAAVTLGQLGFDKVRMGKDTLTIRVPSWRARDVSIEEDLIEEVARLGGYDAIPAVLPVGPIPEAIPHPEVAVISKVKQHLTSLGLQEVVNFSFTGEDLVGENKALKIANSISKEWAYLRVSLIPGLAQTAAMNFNFGSFNPLFEIGSIFQPKDGDLPSEKMTLAVSGDSFRKIKGYFESLLAKLGLENPGYFPCQSEFFAAGSSASVWLGDTVVGEMGTLSDGYKEKTGLRRGVVVGEFDLTLVIALTGKVKEFHPVPKFPAARVDLSIIVTTQASVADIVKVATQANAKDLTSVEPFDIFTNEKLGENKKSVSLGLTFQSRDKTLTDNEVKIEKEKIEKALKDKLSAKIR